MPGYFFSGDTDLKPLTGVVSRITLGHTCNRYDQALTTLGLSGTIAH